MIGRPGVKFVVEDTGEGVLLHPLKPGVPVRFEEVIGCYPGVAEQIVVHGKDLGA